MKTTSFAIRRRTNRSPWIRADADLEALPAIRHRLPLSLGPPVTTPRSHS